MDSFLSFKLSKEKFAVSIHKVLEVLLEYKVIEVPDAPPYIQGVINFRGDIVPIINFRKKFNFEEEPDGLNMLIVLEITQNDKTVIFGAVVDAVQNVFEVNPEDIKIIPEFGSKYNPEYLEGMIQADDDFFMIMDIEKVFSDKEIEIINETSEITEPDKK